MPTIVITNITCTGFANPLTIDLFLDNNSFLPAFSVEVNSAESIPLNLRADYFTDASIVIHRDRIPILQSFRSFTLLDSGSGSTDFFPFLIQDASYGFSLDFYVENNLGTLILAYIRTIAIATLTFILSFFRILFAPLRNLIFGRRDSMK
jgi:hypothetical protein